MHAAAVTGTLVRGVTSVGRKAIHGTIKGAAGDKKNATRKRVQAGTPAMRDCSSSQYCVSIESGKTVGTQALANGQSSCGSCSRPR